MSLKIASVRLRGFRNYSEAQVDVHPRLTVLVGPNGIGKTNIIEAVQVLLSLESFRGASWEELVGWNAERAILDARLQDAPREVELVTQLDPAGNRISKINGKTTRRARDVRAILPCVVFTPEDLRIVKGAADARRSAVDSVGGRLSETYTRVRRDYERAVRQRNKALRDGQASPLLDALTDAVATHGARLAAHRLRLTQRMAAATAAAHAAIAPDCTLEVEYVASWDAYHGGQAGPDLSEEHIREALLEGASSRHTEERARGATLVGPHRDDIRFTIDGRDARPFGSQGQQRTVALAWKLAEVQTVEAVSGTTPVLLLDDVMSELDEGRRHALTALVGTRVQTLATTTYLDYFEPALLNEALIVELPLK